MGGRGRGGFCVYHQWGEDSFIGLFVVKPGVHQEWEAKFTRKEDNWFMGGGGGGGSSEVSVSITSGVFAESGRLSLPGWR